MSCYIGIDLYSNNNVIYHIDDKDKRLINKQLDNKSALKIQAFKLYKRKLTAVVIEPTFNRHWLVDTLMDVGLEVMLDNTAKVIPCDGVKRKDDRYDAYHFSHLMRWVFPTGYN